MHLHINGKIKETDARYFVRYENNNKIDLNEIKKFTGTDFSKQPINGENI